MFLKKGGRHAFSRMNYKTIVQLINKVSFNTCSGPVLLCLEVCSPPQLLLVYEHPLLV